jgi:hypothetical protein
MANAMSVALQATAAALRTEQAAEIDGQRDGRAQQENSAQCAGPQERFRQTDYVQEVDARIV